MLYETWQLIGNDVPTIYYSRIQTEPFENAICFKNKSDLEKEMTKRFSKLLKTEMKIQLIRSHNKDLPIQYNIFYDDKVIMKKCGNFIELASLRDAIFYINKYSIDWYYDLIEHGTMMMEISTGGESYKIPRYGNGEQLPLGSGNIVCLNAGLMRRLAKAVGDRFLAKGVGNDKRRDNH